MTYVSLDLLRAVVKAKRALSEEQALGEDVPVTDEAWDDATTIMEALFDIRSDTGYIIELLEEDDGKEEAENS